MHSPSPPASPHVSQLLSHLSSAADSLRRVPSHPHAAFLSDAAHWFGQSEKRVVVIGEFNAGKSTLLNALLGRRLLKAGLRPMSSEITCLFQGPRDELAEITQQGDRHVHDLAQLESLGTLADGRFRKPDIARLDVSLASYPLPPDIVLVDTPGLNDGPQQSQRAEQAALLSDMVLLLVNAEQVGTPEERRVLRHLHEQFPHKPVHVVVNYMNRFASEEEREDVRSHLRRWLGDSPLGGRAWMEVNAIDALRTVLEGLPPTAAEDDFSALAGLLYDLASRPGEGLPSGVRSRRLPPLRSCAQKVLAWAGQQLAPHHQQLAGQQEARAALSAEVELVRRRLTQLRSGELAQVLQTAAESWESGLSDVELLMRNETRERLQDRGDAWFYNEWEDAQERIQTWCRQRLATLARENGLTAPSFELDADTYLAAPVDPGLPSPTSTEGSIAAGAGLGFLFLGPLGAAIGGGIAALASKNRNDSLPAPCTFYITASHTRWRSCVYRAESGLRSAWSSAFDALLAANESRLTALAPPMPAAESIRQLLSVEQALGGMLQLVEACLAETKDRAGQASSPPPPR
jgi:hypothetical protein